MNYQLRTWIPEDAPEEDAKAFIKMNTEHQGPTENLAIVVDRKTVGGVGFVIF